MTQQIISRSVRGRIVQRVTLVGLVVNAVLGIGKVIAGYLALSQALLADGIHSLSDLVSDVLVLVAARYAHVEADESHPYGHGRIETVASVALGIILFLIGAGIAYDAASRLFNPESLTVPASWALWVALGSVIAKEALYYYTIHYARKINSTLLRANAWHHRTDSLSSLVVIIGIAGTLAGLPYLDAVAAFIVAVMIIHIGIVLVRGGFTELIDTALEPGRVAEIRDHILLVDGVADMHELRSRLINGRAFIDVHIQVNDPRLSVSEGHQISEVVRGQIIRDVEEVDDVVVHIDPEDDGAGPEKPPRLDLRSKVLERLELLWQEIDAVSQIKHVNLHYLGGRIHVELELPLTVLGTAESAVQMEQQFNAAIANQSDIARVRLLYS